MEDGKEQKRMVEIKKKPTVEGKSREGMGTGLERVKKKEDNHHQRRNEARSQKTVML